MLEYGKNDNHLIYYTGKYWNDYPECFKIINTRLFGSDIDWKKYLIENGFTNFRHALILNCGNGWVERELYDFGIIQSATCVEYSSDLVDECNKKKENRMLQYICHDMNTIDFDENKFDVVINFAAGHHIRYIEKVWINIYKWLKPNGYLIQNDYCGPQRNQYSKQQWNQMNVVNDTLDINIKKQLKYPNITQMMIDDSTEAINSDKIIPLTYDIFNVIYHSKSGGAIAYELLTHNNRLFNLDINERKPIVDYIMNEDLKYMKETDESIFHFIIAKNDKSIEETKPILIKHLKNMDIRERLSDYTYGHYSYNTLELNETIYCNKDNIKSIFVYGFSNVESLGIWSIGVCSIIRFKINDKFTKNNTTLQLHVNTLNNNHELSIEVNEQKPINLFIKGNKKINIPIKIPILINKEYPNDVIVIFRYKNVKSPKELKINNDDRKLALFFTSIKLI